MTQNSDAKVKELAYHLWIEAGQPEGRDLDFWLAAELHVAGKAAALAAATPTPAKKRAAKPKDAKPAAEDKPKAAPRGRAKTK